MAVKIKRKKNDRHEVLLNDVAKVYTSEYLQAIAKTGNGDKSSMLYGVLFVCFAFFIQESNKYVNTRFTRSRSIFILLFFI